MAVTNKHGLPDTIYNALIKQNEAYDAGQVNSSVTQLITPPRINVLRKEHFKDIARDLSEEFYALLGSGVHHILQLGATPNMTVEERLFMDIDGWKISGAIDVQDIHGKKVDIYDYKVTSSYAITMNDGGQKPEWEAQTNMYAMLVEANKPLRVRDLYIIAVIRDWSSADARRDPLYPQVPIMKIQMPLWSKMKQMQYARERIALHRKAAFDLEMGEPIVHCTPEERWMRSDKWAVQKIGATKATRVFNDPADAAIFTEDKKKGSNKTEYEIIHRPGTSTRCQYCGVNFWCDQYQTLIAPKETASE